MFKINFLREGTEEIQFFNTMQSINDFIDYNINTDFSVLEIKEFYKEKRKSEDLSESLKDKIYMALTNANASQAEKDEYFLMGYINAVRNILDVEMNLTCENVKSDFYVEYRFNDSDDYKKIG